MPNEGPGISRYENEVYQYAKKLAPLIDTVSSFSYIMLSFKSVSFK